MRHALETGCRASETHRTTNRWPRGYHTERLYGGNERSGDGLVPIQEHDKKGKQLDEIVSGTAHRRWTRLRARGLRNLINLDASWVLDRVALLVPHVALRED